MTPQRKLNITVFFFSYGGNGGIRSEVPCIREWWTETILKMKADPRVGEICTLTIADTPITMSRNLAVKIARQNGSHLCMFVDSDQSPNLHKNEPWFKPFWDTAFNEIYEHYERGPLVIGAPYGGPPNVSENVYVFRWDNLADRGDETAMRLEQYTRHEATLLRGVQEVAALPTGLILYDMRCFDLIEPFPMSRECALDAYKLGQITKAEALSAMNEGYFYYEWKDNHADEKGSTEDVQNTRDIGLCGQAKLGYNPVRCSWDSWIGHWKPWNVGRPKRYTVENIAATFVRTVERKSSIHEQDLDLNAMWHDYVETAAK